MKFREIPTQAANSDSSIEVKESALLSRVHQAHMERLKNPDTPLPEEFESTKEVERRYQADLEAANIHSIAGIDAFKDRLLALPGAYARHIEQVNVSAYTDSGRTGELMYRLRKTQVIAPPNADKERMFRLTLKSGTGRGEGEKEETQLRLRVDGPKALNDRKEFLALWDKGILHNIRTRVYVPHMLPNGHKCEIHFEIYNHPSAITDLMRIEIEFEGIEDAAYAREHKDSLPAWIGKDVTDSREWRSKALVKDGLPENAARELEKLRAASR